MQNNQSLEDKEMKIAQALAVCAELTNTQLSPAAMNVMVDDLLVYPLPDVMTALQRCRRELSSRFTLAEILARLPNQLPQADEAWALVFEAWQNEAVTVVLPEIAQLAAGSSRAFVMLDQKDKTAARMAFKTAYEKMRGEVLASGEKPKWTISAGSDSVNRECVLLQAVKDGKLSREEVGYYLPNTAIETRLLLTANVDVALIVDKKAKPLSNEEGRARVAELIAYLDDQMRKKSWDTSQADREKFEAKKHAMIAAAMAKQAA